MLFQSAIRYLAGKLDAILHFLVRFDGWQDTVYGWFFIISCIIIPICFTIIIWDIGTTLSIDNKKESEKKLKKYME